MGQQDLLFWVSIHHPDDSSRPPQIDGDIRKRYYGYFENEFVEQALFVYDHEAKEGTQWMGDVGRAFRSHFKNSDRMRAHDLSDEQRAVLELLIPKKRSKCRRPRNDNRQTLNDKSLMFRKKKELIREI